MNVKGKQLLLPGCSCTRTYEECPGLLAAGLAAAYSPFPFCYSNILDSRPPLCQGLLISSARPDSPVQTASSAAYPGARTSGLLDSWALGLQDVRTPGCLANICMWATHCWPVVCIFICISFSIDWQEGFRAPPPSWVLATGSRDPGVFYLARSLCISAIHQSYLLFNELISFNLFAQVSVAITGLSWQDMGHSFKSRLSSFKVTSPTLRPLHSTPLLNFQSWDFSIYHWTPRVAPFSGCCFSLSLFSPGTPSTFWCLWRSSVSINIFTMKKLKIPSHTIYPVPCEKRNSRSPPASIYIWKLSLSSITTTWNGGVGGRISGKECPDPDNSIEIVADGYDFMSALFAFCQSGWE